MRLSDLLPDHLLPLRVTDLEISGVTDDPTELRNGFLFCAHPWTDSFRRWSHAAERGARVLIVPTETSEGEASALRNLEKDGIVVLGHPDITKLYGQLAERFRAKQSLFLVGVTERCGRASVSPLLARIWASAGVWGRSLSIRELSVLRTVDSRESQSFERHYGDSTNANPLVVGNPVTHVVVEVSDEDLKSDGTNGLEVDVAVFGDSDSRAGEERGAAEQEVVLAEKVKYGGAAVIRGDDQHVTGIAKRFRSRQRQLITFSTSGTSADLTLLSEESDNSGRLLIASIFGQTHQIQLARGVVFRAEDMLAAIGAAVASGVSVHAAAVAAERVKPSAISKDADVVKLLRVF